MINKDMCRCSTKQIVCGRLILCLFVVGSLSVLWSHPLRAQTKSSTDILIISSYNPDSYNTTQNITAFIEQYSEMGGNGEVIVENMNCLSLSEALSWRKRMSDILIKYLTLPPRLVILLGQEAWAAYLSQENDMFDHVPIFCAMASRNAVLLPNSDVDLETWMPETIDVFDDLDCTNIIAGYAYQYDIVKNVELIMNLYPQTNHVAFISDNTYGGVALQALFKREILKFPNLTSQLLDGRSNTIYTIVSQIEKLPENTAILLGTWKVDKNNAFFMRNAIYAMTGASKAPVFTVTSTGLGDWAVGGYSPAYRNMGEDMARKAYELLNNHNSNVHIEMIPNQYKFDAKMLIAMELGDRRLPDGSVLINSQPSFIEQYRVEFWSAVLAFCALLAGLLVSLWFYVRTKKMKVSLEISAIELLQAKEHAEKSDRLKSAFISNMSHEIRTPLNSIVGFSDILVNTEDADEKQQYIKIIQSNSAILLQLFNDILDLSKIEADTMDFVYTDVDINDLLVEVEGIMMLRDDGPQVIIMVERSMLKCVVNTDKNRLMQVVVNLVSNAVKFTRNGTIRMGYNVSEDEQLISIYVADTGVGIPPENLVRIFERFVKLDNFSQGTGLGLPISQVIVEKLGGRIWAESVLGVGSTFRFTIPYVKGAM